MKYVLYFNISTSRSMCAVTNMAVVYIYLISCFPGVAQALYEGDFKMVPVVPVITGITFYIHIPYGLNFSYEVFVL